MASPTNQTGKLIERLLGGVAERNQRQSSNQLIDTILNENTDDSGNINYQGALSSVLQANLRPDDERRAIGMVTAYEQKQRQENEYNLRVRDAYTKRLNAIDKLIQIETKSIDKAIETSISPSERKQLLLDRQAVIDKYTPLVESIIRGEDQELINMVNGQQPESSAQENVQPQPQVSQKVQREMSREEEVFNASKKVLGKIISEKGFRLWSKNNPKSIKNVYNTLINEASVTPTEASRFITQEIMNSFPEIPIDEMVAIFASKKESAGDLFKAYADVIEEAKKISSKRK